MDKQNLFRMNLAARRKALGMTQEQLASRLNVSPQAVSKWENSSYPDCEMLPRLAAALNVSLDTLFGIRIKDAELDLEQLVTDEIRTIPHDKRPQFFMALMYSALCGCNQSSDDVGRIRDSYENETFSQLKTDRELAIARLNPDLRYFCFMEIPDAGVNSYFGDTTNMVRLFNTLADSDAIRIISYLGASARNKMFSAETISEKLEIPCEKVQNTIDRLDRLGMVWRVSADIADKPVILYGYSHSIPLTLILVLAKSITNYLRFNDPYIEDWEKGAFRRPDGEEDEVVPQAPWWKDGEL
ncbi:MAG: helix-turn-helix transcriptional regulator [Ruminococcus sp.]|nr:helix-turn-helix transcriptional regulator [Ruminococcus sp.]